MANLFFYDKDNDKWLRVSSDNPLPIDMTDATVVAEFTPGSTVNVDSYTPTGDFQPATAANQVKTVTPTTIIDNATFNATVTRDNIDLSLMRNGIITVAIGTVTAGSITVKLQVKDKNNNYIDYLTLETLSTSNATTFDEFYDIAFSTGRIVATSASANIANVTVELQATP